MIYMGGIKYHKKLRKTVEKLKIIIRREERQPSLKVIMFTDINQNNIKRNDLID